MASLKRGRTIQSVIRDGLCTGCGTCAGICPRAAISMEIDQRQGIYLPKMDTEKCGGHCGLCFAVCPGHGVDFQKLSLEIFKQEPNDLLIGNYLNCYIGHSTNRDIRYNAASGGVVTQLLIFLLEKGIINGALVCRMQKCHPLQPESFVARTTTDIIEASRSKYCPVPANIALNEIINSREGERFAVVGLPCHIHGIRKAAQINKKLRERIIWHFGLYCNHAPSFLATNYLIYKKKLKRKEITRIDYRGNGWPGSMKLVLKTGELLQLRAQDAWNSGFGSFFYPFRCMACIDASSELADISFADAWLPELKDDMLGKTMLIVRSKESKQLLQSALLQRSIELLEIDLTDVMRSHNSLLNRRKRGSNAYLSTMRSLHKNIPQYFRELPEPGVRDYIDIARLYLRSRISRNHISWGLISIYCFLKQQIMEQGSHVKEAFFGDKRY